MISFSREDVEYLNDETDIQVYTVETKDVSINRMQEVREKFKQQTEFVAGNFQHCLFLIEMNPEHQLHCSFCGKPQSQVKRLIAGPDVYICDECVEMCMDIISEALEVEKAGTGTKAGGVIFSLPVTDTAGIRQIEEELEEE